MLVIKDRPGVIKASLMRQLFEQAIAQTAAFAKNTPLGIIKVNGEFSHYANPDTDTMWLGFALGMRCHERVSKAAGSGQYPAIQPSTNGERTTPN